MAIDQYPKAYLYMRIVQAKLFIDKSYAEPINLKDITNEAFFSKYHFIRTFKAIYGYSPHQYLKKVRLEKAKQFLREGQSINEACHSVGFESTNTFMSLFKKITGQTPSEFRKDHIQRKKEEESNPLKFVPGCFMENFKIAILKSDNKLMPGNFD